MSKPGPKKTPTAVLKLRGSWRGKARANEPELPGGTPECPEWLTGEAKARWNRLAPLLAKAGLLTQGDDMILAMLCQSWSDYIESRKNCLDANGRLQTVLRTDKGSYYMHPGIAAMTGFWSQVVKGLSHFGLSPATRSDVTAAGEREIDELEQLIIDATKYSQRRA
jgi:P27 family predicted phage terminase small subunit